MDEVLLGEITWIFFYKNQRQRWTLKTLLQQNCSEWKRWDEVTVL